MVAIGKGKKVLLSAYACEPGKGSEPGVGWHWALEIARLGHEVWVLTRANNRPTIEAGLTKMKPIPNLHFIYYDLPAWARKRKKLPGGIYLYYLFWQWGAYQLAKISHNEQQFDLVHHITFGNIRLSSFLGNLGIPFTFGPVGGGETAPWRLRFGYGLRGWIVDYIRDLANWLVKIDPIVNRTFKQADRIFVTTEQSLSLLPHRYSAKARIAQAIGSAGKIQLTSPSHKKTHANKQKPFAILYVGRLIYWKGMHLGLGAFARLLKKYPDAQLTIRGNGPEESLLRKYADRLGISDKINWVGRLSENELSSLYAKHDIFLFPSLHDSGGMVVLEAMAHGLPVICFDLGGPGIIVNNSCGRVIPVKGFSADEITDRLAVSIGEIIQNIQLNKKLSLGAINRVKALTWSETVSAVYRVGK